MNIWDTVASAIPTKYVDINNFTLSSGGSGANGAAPQSRPLAELLKSGPPYNLNEIQTLREYRGAATRPTSGDTADHYAALAQFPEFPGTSDKDAAEAYDREVTAGVRTPRPDDGWSSVLSRFLPALAGVATAGVMSGAFAPAAAAPAAAGGTATTLADAGLTGSMIPSGAAGTAISGATPAFAGAAPTLATMGPTLAAASTLPAAAGAISPTVAGVAPAAAGATVAPAAGSSVPGWVNPALLGAGIAIPAVTGIIGANQQANAIKDAANSTAAASQTAADATLTGTREAIAAQQKMYDQQRADFKPFLDVAPRSLATLQSSVYGGPQTYKAADGTTQSATGQQFDLAGLQKQQTDALTNFKPTETAAYDWQKTQGLTDLDRQLRMMGRGSGTVAANSTGKFLGNLNATEYDKGYQRLSSLNDLNYNRTSANKADYQNSLLNLIKTAQGAASSTSAAGQNFANASSTAAINQGNNLATIATNQGNNQANASLAQGQSTANLYQGLSQLPLQAGGLAVQGGWKPFA